MSGESSNFTFGVSGEILLNPVEFVVSKSIDSTGVEVDAVVFSE